MIYLERGKIAYVGAEPEKKFSGVVYVPVLDIEYNDLHQMNILSGNVAIMSKRGVRSLKLSEVRIENADVLCIGDKTALALEMEYGLNSSYPENMNSKGLLDLILARDWRLMTLVGSDHTSAWFLDRLREKGVDVNYVKAYSIKRSSIVLPPETFSSVRTLFFGSSLSFEYFIESYGRSVLQGRKVIAIGENTSETMRRLGVNPDKIEESPDIDGLLLGAESEY